MQETRGRSLSWEDPLEESTATHSSILVKKKVNLAQTFTSDLSGGGQDWGGDNNWQGGDQPQEPQKEFHKQTPDEAVETMWQGLDTYREMSEQDKAQT